MQILRRHLLLALAASPWLGRATAAPKTTSADVIVLGAGMSGLNCARELRQLGYSVIVLEARDRIGGRTWTDNTLGVPLDLGAAWIHGVKGNPLTRLASDAGIQTFATDWESEQLYQGSRALKAAEQASADEVFEELLEIVQRKKKKAKVADNLADALASACDELLDDDTTAAAVRYKIWSEFGSEYGEESDALSLSAWDEDEELTGAHVLLRSGYGALVAKMARGIDIRLRNIIERVEHGSEGVRVHTRQGVFTADALVCTLPLGVLKGGSVRFEPPLPPGHRAAIARLSMGALDKVVLRFPSVFWPSKMHRFGRIDGNPSQRTEFYNLAVMHSLPILLALTSGNYSRSLEAMSERDVVAKMMAELRAMFGNRIPEPEGVLRTRWATDPFARGSYSIVPPGASMQDLETLAKPVGDSVFMAGEATVTDYPGTVHGAYLSGLRAAAEVDEQYG